MAKQGHSVLVLEHHYQFGGLATWFKRAGGHIFDISLHGFPVGMIKSCRRYWTKEIADSIVQLKNIRFVNPQYDLRTTFDRLDFTKILQDTFKIAKGHIEEFYEHFEKWIISKRWSHHRISRGIFPGRDDVKRLLLSQFLRQWIFVYGSCRAYGMYSPISCQDLHIQDGTDSLIRKVVDELAKMVLN